MSQIDMLPATAPDPDRDRAYEVDRTPRGLVRAALDAHLSARHDHARWQAVYVAGNLVWSAIEGGPLRVLDVCAGSGVWASEMRAWCDRHGIPVEITALEVRPEEREHLARVADEVIIGDALDLLDDDHYFGAYRWHIVIGNPAFSLLAMGKPERRSLLPVLLDLARAVVLLSTSQAFTRSEAAARWLHDHPPALELRIAQGVRFRATSGTDGISYSVTSWVQHQRHVLPGTPWPCQVLVLPAEARRWREIPGREAEP
jgi:predicted RNA methylase